MKRRKTAKSQGFSLIEVLLVVVLLGVISAIGIPVITHLMDEGQIQLAKSVSHSVNAAKHSYSMKHYQAEQIYAQAHENTSRYGLIQEYLPESNVPLEQLLPEGFRITMNDSIHDRVTLWGPQGEISY